MCFHAHSPRFFGSSTQGGYAGGDPSDPMFQELIVRWLQASAFFPIMRLVSAELFSSEFFFTWPVYGIIPRAACVPSCWQCFSVFVCTDTHCVSTSVPFWPLPVFSFILCLFGALLFSCIFLRSHCLVCVHAARASRWRAAVEPDLWIHRRTSPHALTRLHRYTPVSALGVCPSPTP